MIDFKSYCKANKAIWACTLHNSHNETLGAIPAKYMEKCDVNVLKCMDFDKEKLLALKLPQDVITNWHLCSEGLKALQGEAKIRSQLIWRNKFIQSKNRSLFYSEWH